MERPGELISGMQRLKRATRDLQTAWTETQAVWNDAASRDFQQRYLDPILPTLRRVLAATSEMDDTYRRAIAECTDDEAS
jgi:hypothetical protein